MSLALGCGLFVLEYAISETSDEYEPGSGGADLFFGLLSISFILVLTWMQFMVFIKRFHDLGRSGAWTLLLFIPLANILIFPVMLLVLGLIPGQSVENPHGPVPGVAKRKSLP